MESLSNNYKHIKGWGIDADLEDHPNYPYKKYTGDDHKRINWERPPLQPVNVEILHSNERPNVSATFGSAFPPSGLSGAIRRIAFRFSESEYGHWLNLLLADRVNMVEGIIDDLKHGHIPNILAEKGMKAEWKYNKKGLITKVLVVAGVAYIAMKMMGTKKKKLRHR